MKEKLEQIREAAKAQLADANADLEAIRIRFLGKKGELTGVQRGMGQLSAEERPKIGQLANEVREYIENAIAERAEADKRAALDRKLRDERIDVTMPGKAPEIGKRHPLAQVQKEMEDIFIGMGFGIVEGPEVGFGVCLAQNIELLGELHVLVRVRCGLEREGPVVADHATELLIGGAHFA